MAEKIRIIKFNSDSAFSHFKDAAEWRHAANYMTINDAKLEIEVRGDIDPVLFGQATDMGGYWVKKKEDDDGKA